MENLSKEIEYLKGLADGMQIADKTAEGKVIAKLLEIVGRMASSIDSIADEVLLERVENLEDEMDDIEEELELLDAVVFDSEDDDERDDDDEGYIPSYLLDEDDDDDDDEDFYNVFDDESLDDYDSDDDDYFEIRCPSCGEDIVIDFDMIENDNIICPECHNKIDLELDFEDDEEADEDKE